MMRKMVLSRGGALLGALACTAAVSLAVPAAASASVTSLTSCQNITAPGTYRLDANVTLPVGVQECFVIFASDVTLLLNGHTVQGPLSPPFAESGVDVQGANAKIVGPGTITGWGTFGIVLTSGGNGKVRGVTVTNNRDRGIFVSSAGNDLRGNVITDNEDGGIVLTVDGTANTIIGNSAHGNGEFDLVDPNANCDSNVWRGNDFGTANIGCIH
jgi:parallel beta-helix repeat protein